MIDTEDYTPQRRMEAKLAEAGIPAKEIRCYGSQVMITAWSEDAAERWRELLGHFCRTVRPVRRSLDYNQVNRRTALRPTTHRVWRVWGTV